MDQLSNKLVLVRVSNGVGKSSFEPDGNVPNLKGGPESQKALKGDPMGSTQVREGRCLKSWIISLDDPK